MPLGRVFLARVLRWSGSFVGGDLLARPGLSAVVALSGLLGTWWPALPAGLGKTSYGTQKTTERHVPETEREGESQMGTDSQARKQIHANIKRE